MEQPYYREDGLSPNLAYALGLPLEEGEIPSRYDALRPRTGYDILRPIDMDFNSTQATEQQNRIVKILHRIFG